jgi:hypothetical protein
MRYEDMSPEQKKEYGFVKITKKDLELMGWRYAFRMGKWGKRLYVLESIKNNRMFTVVNDGSLYHRTRY